MTAEVTSLSLKIDSTSAKEATVALDRMAISGKGAEVAATALESSTKSAAAALGAAAASAKAMDSAQAALQRNAKGAAEAFKGTGEQAKLSGHHTAQLSAQLQDLFVQIQAGGSPLTALIQQGSQLSAVFGGVVPALKAVGSILFTTTTAFLAVGAAAAAVGAAFLIGREQSADLAKTLVLTGNAAGLTEGQFNSLAAAIAASTKTTIGSTRDTLAGLAGTGRLSSDALTQAAVAAQLLSKVTGQSADDIVKDFARAADGPARYAEDMSRSYNFLATQLDHIRTLDEQGRKNEALAETFKLLIPRLEEASRQVTGLGDAFGEAKRELSGFLDGLLSLYRTSTPEQRIAEITRQLKELAAAGQKGYTFGPSTADLMAEAAGLQRTIDGMREVAAARAKSAQQEQALNTWNKLKEQSLDKQAQLTKALDNANALADQAGLSAADRVKVLQGIRDRFSLGLDKAQLDADLATIRGALDQQVKAVANAQSILEALRAGGNVGDRAYYDARRALMGAEQAAEERALTAEIARLQRFKGTTQENLENRKAISEAQVKLAEARAAGQAKNVVLTLQETSTQEALARAYHDTEIAAAATLTQAARRNRLRAEDVGLGDQERQRVAELEAIAERFTSKQLQLDTEFRNGRLRGREEQYRQELTLLEYTEAAELKIAEDGYQKKLKAQGDFTNGASRALQNYTADAADTAKQTESLFANSFKGAEDALVQFVATGKLNFTSLANSIISDIARIIIKQQLAKVVDSASGSGGWAGLAGSVFSALIGGGASGGSGMPDSVPTRGGRAGGGPVSAGGLYRVNEMGPELLNVGGRQYLMMGEQPGSVTPNGGGAGGTTVHQTFLLQGSVDRRTQQQVANAAGQGVQRAMARNG